MSVLQGLQYIKDHLDGSLTFRWSCRMAICGSCGMMLNGVPELACETFLRDYLPGPARVEPLSHFPDRARPRDRPTDFLRSWKSVQAVPDPGAGKAARKARSSRRRRRWTSTTSTPSASTAALLRGLPAIRHEHEVHRSGGAGAAAAVQRRLARCGQGRSGWTSSTPRTASGAVRSSVIAPRSVRRASIRRVRSTRTRSRAPRTTS